MAGWCTGKCRRLGSVGEDLGSAPSGLCDLRQAADLSEPLLLCGRVVTGRVTGWVLSPPGRTPGRDCGRTREQALWVLDTDTSP